MAETPPHHPTHNVNISEDVIRTIVAAILPSRGSTSIETLAHGKGFNNRIYFLSTESSELVDSGNNASKLVLKVSGTNFGPEKARNEIACLVLLEHHCPDISAPKVLAWSENGSTINKVVSTSHSCDETLQLLHEQILVEVGKPTSKYPWILLTRVPGRPLCEADFSDPGISNVIKQIASWMAIWRSQLLPFLNIGNLDLAENRSPQITPPFRLSTIFPASLLLCSEIPTAIPSTRLEYYKIRLENELKKLESNEIFESSHAVLAGPLRRFINSTLPQLELARDMESQFVFTHYDLSPRNILVADKPPLTLTGVVDFEFAGIFPAEEEFTNLMVTHKGDWPQELDGRLLHELALQKSQMQVPLLQGPSFAQACSIIGIIENIAPWWLLGQGKTEAIEEKLKNARRKVQQSLETLTYSS